MKIFWKENPLATLIELDAHDRRVLRLLVEIEDLKERIGIAHLDLDPKDREWRDKTIGPRSLEAAVASALTQLEIPDDVEKKYAERAENYIGALLDAHAGDCTCQPCSCIKCHAESLLGVNTTKGLGKHEGSYVDDAFAPRSGGSVPTLREAIESLRDYRPEKGAGWEKCSQEEFDAHVPRWTKEAKGAHDWLVAYEKEHFSK